VAFETTVPWQASVAETRAISWLGIEPESGPAGNNTILITLQPNTGEASRTAVITITAGGEKVTVTVTQAGADGTPAPEPTIQAEDLPTRIDWDSTWDYPASDYEEAGQERRSGFIRIQYDEQHRPIFFGDYEFEGENGEKEKLSFYSERKYDRSQKGRIVAYERYFECEWDSSKAYPIAHRQDYEEDEIYILDASGRLTERIVPREETGGADCHYIFAYNADGTLAKYTGTGSDAATVGAVYEWENGNIVAISELSGNNTSDRTEYTYTEYPNNWHGIDLAITLEDLMPGYALGIIGKSSKNLIATKTEDYGSGSCVCTYDYTFDDKGRIATITAVSRETRHDGKTETETEVYTFRYGPQQEKSYPETTHLIKQEVIDKGTRDHSDADCYTSYLKIRNHLSDGTTDDEEATEEIRICTGYGNIGDQTIPAGATPTASAPTSVSLETSVSEENDYIFYHFTLHYPYFDIPTDWELRLPPNCRLYTGYETRYQEYPMPIRPVTEAMFEYDMPEITGYGDGRYHFSQEIWANLSPSAQTSAKTSVYCDLIPPTE